GDAGCSARVGFGGGGDCGAATARPVALGMVSTGQRRATSRVARRGQAPWRDQHDEGGTPRLHSVAYSELYTLCQVPAVPRTPQRLEIMVGPALASSRRPCCAEG